MKKIIMIIAVALSFIGCSGSSTPASENPVQDSLRLDSIRRDSIKRDSINGDTLKTLDTAGVDRVFPND